MDLLKVYNRLYEDFGPQHWWPADSAFEVVLGAVLVQNTSWNNVQKCIDQLRDEKIFSPEAILSIPENVLAEKIRSSGYYHQKARRLRDVLSYFQQSAGGDFARCFSRNPETLRQELLALRGVGPETADSILLYAGNLPFFVVDAYTRRFLYRHHVRIDSKGQPDDFVLQSKNYERIRLFFERRIPRDVSLYNEFHALFVELGKKYCRKTSPLCDQCPLRCFNH